MSLLCCPFLSRTIRSICLMQAAHQLMEVISGDVFAIGFSCRLLHSRALPALLCVNPVRSNLRFISRSLKSSGSGFRSYSPLSSPNAVPVETREGQSVRAERTKNLQVKLAELGIGCDLSKIGQYMHALCPKCDGGESKENSLSIFIREDGKLAMWSCFRTDKCGWKGRIEVSENGGDVTVYQNGGSSFVFKSQSHRTITETDFDLEPLCPEVLTILGKDALKQVIETAELFPIRGLFSFSSFFTEIDDYFLCQGSEIGVSTGWRALDDLYNIVPGELTVISGVPNSGKSEWIDALMCNINENYGWTFVLCSMENKVQEHARKLLEKHIKKPFFNIRYGESVERMSPKELEEGKKWLNDTFHLIRCDDDALPSIEWVLTLAKAAVLRYGVRGLVIDPYNELDHQRPLHQTETEYVSQMLTKIKRFAQHHSCHVWFVAHPRQLQNWGGNAPNLYDISGSAHFINKCDNGIIIHRNRDKSEGPLDGVQVYVRKVRNKVIGRIGDAHLIYDRVSGRFLDDK
ncbi:hypothetical protein HPP92_013208 [Vanilla planifolia]|uniref:SF4 helicase domain-containing protein n=1 Tax=Vanilla planifolia TaxID=51239 RepID=A0A835QYY7_VANPL|nr:hypothetical protein HPP92_013208 [Vanilla planifolia]